MVQKWLPRPRLLIVSSRGLFFSLSCLPASECPPRDFCKSLLFSTAELSQGQQRFHECLRVAAGYIERWHSASWPALLVQLGTEVACNDLAPSLPSMKTNTLGTRPRSGNGLALCTMSCCFSVREKHKSTDNGCSSYAPL